MVWAQRPAPGPAAAAAAADAVPTEAAVVHGGPPAVARAAVPAPPPRARAVPKEGAKLNIVFTAPSLDRYRGQTRPLVASIPAAGML